jgi:hypothetical protein
MKIIFYAFLLLPIISLAQKFTINGNIRDGSTGENLIGATVFNLKTSEGTTSNTYGFFSITLGADTVDLRVSFVGYESSRIKFALKKDTTLSVNLTSGIQLNEVVVSGKAMDKIQESSRMGTIDVPIDQIKKLPAFLGEVDMLKVLQLLPGVQAGSEGSSGLYVRGGGPDQNLILLDGVPVYNASHLFGFFSVFNADAINNVELIKGGFPARYGGRLSSVIDINMKEGNNKKLKGEGSIGLVASKLTLEGPIKDKTTFIISARRTYIDLLARPIIKKASKGETVAGYYFYDLNAKINHKINDKNRIYFSTYTGDDKAYARSKYSYESTAPGPNNGPSSVKSKDEAGLKWGNITGALRWNSIITNKLFSNVTATYSRYRFSVFANEEETRTNPDASSYFHTEYVSGIRDWTLKTDFDYLPNPNHFIKFGGQATEHLFTPGVLSYRSTEKADTTFGAKPTYSKEFSLYAEDDFLITPKLKVNMGVHASGLSVEDRFYKSLQPRLSARYLVTPLVSLKASYAKMTQFIHLLTNAGLGLPTDLWVPATSRIGPEQSYLSSIGGAYNLNNKYEFSIEGYYKKMNGLIEYKDGANYLDLESDWQDKVEVGSGKSYGAEFFIQKKTGRLNGWIGYTLSKANRTFANINEGRTFPYRYDRRHDLKIATTYQLRPNKDFSLTWVFGSGNAVTLPQSSYPQMNDHPVPYYPNESAVQFYDGRNSYRMRPYHRLDLSYTTTKKKKWGERSWTFAVYNVYSRRNPFYIDLTYDKQGNKKFAQYSLFPIIPSVAYRFKF